MIHPWLLARWQQLIGLGERTPHALLFSGPAGVGKRDLAEAFAARLLCDAPQASGEACGQCAACVLRLAGNHPDLSVLEPDDAVSGEDAAEGASSKSRSAQIRIEQVRALQQSLTVTGHRSARRAVIVEPAEAMNPFTANALLKLLEEPPEGCVLVLVTAAPQRLLATLRSRCQQWTFAPPDVAAVTQWQSQHSPEARALLALCGGAPLAAERLLARGMGALHGRFVSDMAGAQRDTALALAGRWDAWLKSKEASTAGLDIVTLVDWTQRWVSDLAQLALGGTVRFHPGVQPQLERLAAATDAMRILNCYNEFIRIRRVAQHPLNTRLMLEDMLLRYTRALAGRR